MNPTDTPHTPKGSIPIPCSHPLYKYPAYTFDKKYENDDYQRRVFILDWDYHLRLVPLDRYIVAEFVFLMSFVLTDTLNFRFMNGIGRFVF